MMKTLPSSARDVDSTPDQVAKISHALWPKKPNIEQKQYCNKFNKDFKNGPIKKNLIKERKSLSKLLVMLK